MATFSILGYDPETGEVGGAVQSRVFTLTGVLTADADAGVVATQAIVDVSYGPKGIALLKAGMKPDAIIKAIWESDPDPHPDRWTKQGRQFAVIDLQGETATFTGPKATTWAGGKQGTFCTAQGNILAGPAVVEGMVKAFEETKGHLSMRLMAALDAGQAAGGDTRGMQAASMVVVQEGRRRLAEQRHRASLPGGRQETRSRNCAAWSRTLERVPGRRAANSREVTSLIVGGPGALGRALALRLLAAGRPVRIMTRNPAGAADLAAAGAAIVRGDLLDRDSLAEACRGVEVVTAAAHSIFGRGVEASVHVDGRGHRDLIDAAVAARARHFVYTSVYDHGPEYRAVPFFRIKYEVEDYLKASPLGYTILRPTAFMETHAHMLIGEPILRNGRTILFGRGNQPRNFAAADVARIAELAPMDPSLKGQTVDVGGPTNPTSMDVVRLYERASGRTARVTHLPLGLLRLASGLTRPFHPGISQVLRAGVLGDSIDQRFDSRLLERRFSFQSTAIEDWVSRKLGGVG